MTDPRAAALVLSAAFVCACAAVPATRAPAPRQVERSGAGTRYLLYLPPAYESREAWPLILFLHGGGERGDDLALVRREGLPRLLEIGADLPFVVVSPQERRRGNWNAESLAKLLDHVTRSHRIDPSRVYATGLSSGAVATLELAVRHPDRIAAVAPVSANVIPPDLCRMKGVAAWVFHSAGDERIPFARAERLARELEACGGEVELTIYARADHDAWTETFANRALYDWFLRHRR